MQMIHGLKLIRYLKIQLPHMLYMVQFKTENIKISVEGIIALTLRKFIMFLSYTGLFIFITHCVPFMWVCFKHPN